MEQSEQPITEQPITEQQSEQQSEQSEPKTEKYTFLTEFKLGELFARYLQMIKQSQNLNDEKYRVSYSLEEVYHFEVALLHFLNHISTNDNNEPVKNEEEAKLNIEKIYVQE